MRAAVPFVRLLGELSQHVDRLVVFGRLAPGLDDAPELLEGDSIRFVALPHYERLGTVTGFSRAALGSRAAFVRALPELDAVWLFGPHPLAVAFALAAARAGVPAVLGVRQDFPRYVGARYQGPRRAPMLLAAYALEWQFRFLARSRPAIVAGDELARHYRRSPRLMSTGFSLVARADLDGVASAPTHAGAAGPVVLSVGRLEPEKNPLLLAEVLAALVKRHHSATLRVAGNGKLSAALAERAGQLGVRDRLVLLGHVPFGPLLRDEFRSASVLLHISWTDGLPQVLYEAMAAGLPIVATDVGGIRGALQGGRLGVLIQPGDALAAAAALERVLDDAGLRTTMVQAGRARVEHETMESQARRIVDVVQHAILAQTHGQRFRIDRTM
jgi:glycosyltransferase involved in cell wall biosynthesis